MKLTWSSLHNVPLKEWKKVKFSNELLMTSQVPFPLCSPVSDLSGKAGRGSKGPRRQHAPWRGATRPDRCEGRGGGGIRVELGVGAETSSCPPLTQGQSWGLVNWTHCPQRPGQSAVLYNKKLPKSPLPLARKWMDVCLGGNEDVSTQENVVCVRS